jgi:hypothetical protein
MSWEDVEEDGRVVEGVEFVVFWEGEAEFAGFAECEGEETIEEGKSRCIRLSAEWGNVDEDEWEEEGKSDEEELVRKGKDG